ncbi:hypothetical protein [Streptomyces inhibens]|uniref:hypothetical protein n=1 Tax=Streptomyces inhibens TaxID=2293571 RepID=UPI001EE7474D|nr:hypothetical protein [Streptomyces inhibens]UKY48535.1 hypothetical protein KI385_06815 [Streptomyces inhibens]
MPVLIADRSPTDELVLRIVDARSGQAVEIAPGRRSPLRVCVHVPGLGGLSDLRVLVVADVLGRTAELLGGQVFTGLTARGRSEGWWQALARRASALGIHPAVAYGDPQEVGEALGGPVDIHVTGPMKREGAGRPADVVDGIRLAVDAESPPDRSEYTDDPGAAASDSVTAVSDPLAVRLALLTRAHHTPVDLTPKALAAADERLVRWRSAVADWARAPSKPMCADILRQALTGLEEDLHTPAVLEALSHLESQAHIPYGAKFETFVYLDRVLGLDFADEVGRSNSQDPPL